MMRSARFRRKNDRNDQVFRNVLLGTNAGRSYDEGQATFLTLLDSGGQFGFAAQIHHDSVVFRDIVPRCRPVNAAVWDAALFHILQ